MSGRGRSKKQGAGRGRAPFEEAPTPAQSAWARSAPAPAPTQSAWGTPAQGNSAPAPTQSAWGRSAPVQGNSAPTQSAWGRSAPVQGNSAPPPGMPAPPSGIPAPAPGMPAPPPGIPAPAPTQSAWGRPAPVLNPVPTRSEEQGRQQPQREPQRKQESQPTASRGSTGYRGNGESRGAGDAVPRNSKSDRGSTRGKVVIRDVLHTKPTGVSTKKGTSGQSFQLLTNHYRVLKKPNWELYQYRVDFNPPIENELFKKKLLAEQKKNLSSGYLFDGTMLFLSVNLHNEVTQFMTKDREENPIQITVKFVGTVGMLTSASIQILNLILRRSMGALELKLIGRNFFDAVARIDIPQHHLQLWPGYVTSIRQHETDILLCCEVTNKVMRTETVLDILMTCRNMNRGDWRTQFEGTVIGMVVLTDYNNKTYRIDDISYDQTPEDTFETRNGPITFVDYYRRKHNITIRNTAQPLLLSRSKDRDIRAGQPDFILLIPELCRATGMTDNMRNNRRLMDDVAYYTRLPPNRRMEKYKNFNKRLQSTAASMNALQEWNFGLDTELVTVPGRRLPNEKIYFANGKQENVELNTCDWSKSFRNNTMYVSQNLLNWALIVPEHKWKDADNFVGILQRAGNGMRYRVEKPNIIGIPDERVSTYASAINGALNKDPQLVMCVVMNNRADLYGAIKKICCIDRPVPSQVMLWKTIVPKPGKDLGSVMSVGTKVAIQMNAKLGGAPWMVDIPLEGLMVIGFDVCHDSKDKNKTRSYGAMVATMDMKRAQNYYSTVSAHENGQELSNSIALMTQKALKSYGTQFRELPTRIIMYRDGVGEGQTDYVLRDEVNNIVSMLGMMYKGQLPKFTFVVTSKRINARFFQSGANPFPGTVVDDVVTMPERYDFFLISQSVRNGTVSPTNYNVIYDTSKMSPDVLQRFTYKMTHLYYNWSGTLGVPAVCQYAHKLAFLVGTYLHQAPHTALEKKLYFL